MGQEWSTGRQENGASNLRGACAPRRSHVRPAARACLCQGPLGAQVPACCLSPPAAHPGRPTLSHSHPPQTAQTGPPRNSSGACPPPPRSPRLRGGDRTGSSDTRSRRGGRRRRGRPGGRAASAPQNSTAGWGRQTPVGRNGCAGRSLQQRALLPVRGRGAVQEDVGVRPPPGLGCGLGDGALRAGTAIIVGNVSSTYTLMNTGCRWQWTVMSGWNACARPEHRSKNATPAEKGRARSASSSQGTGPPWRRAPMKEPSTSRRSAPTRPPMSATIFSVHTRWAAGTVVMTGMAGWGLEK